MIVVFFEPTIPGGNTGRITECLEATKDLIEGMGKPFLKVDEYREDWSHTHRVSRGKVVERKEADVTKDKLVPARMRLKVLRNALLVENFDAIRINPVRWEGLTTVKQQALLDYRQALLDWPKTETDPLNPTPPTPPEL